MGWLLLTAAILLGIGLAYYRAVTSDRRRLRKRLRHLSPRERRKAELHAWDQEEEASRMGIADREVATFRGARRLRVWGIGLGGGSAGPGGDSFDGGGAGDGDCD